MRFLTHLCVSLILNYEGSHVDLVKMLQNTANGGTDRLPGWLMVYVLEDAVFARELQNCLPVKVSAGKRATVMVQILMLSRCSYLASNGCMCEGHYVDGSASGGHSHIISEFISEYF